MRPFVTAQLSRYKLYGSKVLGPAHRVRAVGSSIQTNGLGGDTIAVGNVSYTQLAVDGQVEERQLAFALGEFETHPDRPIKLESQRRFMSDQSAFVPRLAALRRGSG
jgi:hypothetical protein